MPKRTKLGNLENRQKGILKPGIQNRRRLGNLRNRRNNTFNPG
jgi:hypothetical protein